MYMCEICKNWVSDDEINFMSGHDYQYWAAEQVCDCCINSCEICNGEESDKTSAK